MLKMKFAWRAWAAMLLAVVMMAGLLPAAAEAPETADAQGGLAVVYKLAKDQAEDEAFRAAFQTLLTPLVLDAVNAQRDVKLLHVDGVTFSKAQKINAATMQAEIDETIDRKTGSNSQLQTNLRNNIEQLTNNQKDNLLGVTELWFVQNYPMFAVEGTGTNLKEKNGTPAKIIDAIGELLKAYPDMTLNLVWFGQDTADVGEILFDEELIRVNLKADGKSEYAQRVNAYVIAPEKTSAAVSTDAASPVGLIRSVLGLAVPAPAVQAVKGEDGVFAAEYVHVNDEAAWLHITTADGAKINKVELTATVETDAGASAAPVAHQAVLHGSEAWVLVPGAAYGDKMGLRVTTKASAVTVQGYAPAEDVEARAALTAADVQPIARLEGMQKQPLTFRVLLNTRSLTKDDLSLMVTAQDGQGTYMPAFTVAQEDADDMLCLAITTSELRVDDGMLDVKLFVTDSMNQSVLPGVSIPYSIGTLAPVFDEAKADAYVWERFTDLPGKASPSATFLLDEYFSDPEGEALTYRAENDLYWRLDGSSLYFSNGAYAEGAHDVIVTATDLYGMETARAFSITQRNAEEMLNAWRFEAQDGTQQTGQMEAVKEITLTLDGARADFDEMMRQYGLTGSFEERIVVTASMTTDDGAAVTSATDLPAVVTDDTLTSGAADNGMQVAYAPAQDGAPVTLTLTLPEQTTSMTVNVTFDAVFAENGMALPELLPALTVSYGNTAPALQSGMETLLTAESQADDLLGKEVSIALDTLFASTTVPDELFGDGETADSLIYTVTITGDAAALYDGDEAREPDSTPDGASVYVLEPGQGGEKLDVRFTGAGEATIVLTAKDSGGLAAADSVTWQVTLSSLHQLVMLIAIIVAAVLLILIVIIIIVRIKTRPNFRGTQLVLDTPDGGQVKLKLDYWDTHSVTLANLAIAAKLAPITRLPIDRLAQITISPARGKNRRFTMKGAGEAEALLTRIGTESTNLRKGFYMGLGQKVVLGEKSAELLSVCIQRDANDDMIL